MTELPPIPTDPAAMKAWVDALGKDDLMALTQRLMNGALTAAAGAVLADIQPRNSPIDVPPAPEGKTALTLTIELRGAKPRIWRRLVLPGDLTLDEAHMVFQAAMGWTDSHLHRFLPGDAKKNGIPYFITEFDEQEGDEGTRETDIRLDQVLRTARDRLEYLYDFGDGWEHRVTLESVEVLPETENVELRCLRGARACPPEDVGGVGGYQEVADWLRAGAPPEQVPEPFESAQHAHRWLPPDYDPDAFDPAEVTAEMLLWASRQN